jgi:hypothetical protein
VGNPVLTIPDARVGSFEPPKLFVAIGSGDPSSPSLAEEVLTVLRDTVLDLSAVLEKLGLPPGSELPPGFQLPECAVATSSAELRALYEAKGHSPETTVVLYSGNHGLKGAFMHTMRGLGQGLPDVAGRATWGVDIGPRVDTHERRVNCAQQLRSDFVLKFSANLSRVGTTNQPGSRETSDNQAWLPWGLCPRGRAVPVHIEIPAGTDAYMELLQSGPDLRGAMPDETAATLPDGRLSWRRIPLGICEADGQLLTRVVVDAFAAFEAAARAIVSGNDEYVRRALLSGVDVDPQLANAYLQPSSTTFGIRRLDLHIADSDTTGLGVYASESDEMPGGGVHAYHLDKSYGLNQQAWAKLWDDLTKDRTEMLVFLVSTGWSIGYLEETRWLAADLVANGYPATVVTTEELNRIKINDNAVYVDGQRVGAINRMFPIFEARGYLAEIVLAAQEGLVRLLPEFAFYGNKALFALFRSHDNRFRSLLAPDLYDLLDQVMPASCLVLPGGQDGLTAEGFPFRLPLPGGNSYTVESLDHLYRLPSSVRSEVVLKVAGANNQAARMYGVLMGKALSDEIWEHWLDSRLRGGQSFIVQQRHRSQVLHVPVLNWTTGVAERFASRALLRPWAARTNGTSKGYLLSSTLTLVPKETERVHGMVDMAQGPIRFI